MSGREIRYNLRRVLLIALFLLIIGAVTFALLARESFSEMLRSISEAKPAFVGLAICAYIFATVLWAARWRVALSTVGHRVGLRDLHLLVFGSIFINNVTPFTYSGGDPFARVYLLNKVSWVPYSSGFAATASEFILDLPVFLSLLVFGLLLSVPAASILLALLLAAIWIASAAMLVPLLSRILHNRVGAGVIGRFIARVLKRLRGPADRTRIVKGVERFYSEARAIINHRKNASFLIVFSTVIWSLHILRVFLIFQAFGYTPQLSMLLLCMTLPLFVGLIPALPAGLGTLDAAFVSILIAFGIPLHIAISVALVERAITFVLGTLIGVSALSYLGIRMWGGKSIS